VTEENVSGSHRNASQLGPSNKTSADDLAVKQVDRILDAEECDTADITLVFLLYANIWSKSSGLYSAKRKDSNKQGQCMMNHSLVFMWVANWRTKIKLTRTNQPETFMKRYGCLNFFLGEGLASRPMTTRINYVLYKQLKSFKYGIPIYFLALWIDHGSKGPVELYQTWEHSNSFVSVFHLLLISTYIISTGRS